MKPNELTALAERERTRLAGVPSRLLCCMSTSCLASGSARTREALQAAVDAGRLAEQVEVVPTGCLGLCSHGPIVRAHRPSDDDRLYQRVTPEAAPAVVAAQVDGDAAAAELVLRPDIPFFTRQHRIVLSEAGLIDPERLEEYVAHGGYGGLVRALFELTPAEVCDQIERSGLRGRGGAGYPTHLKWELLRGQPGRRKFVVANGDEGDPGAYMDRSLMEADPHRVLEGLAIAGYATGAEQGYLYVRGEYPIAVARLTRAIRAAERQGLLGRDILGSGFSFKAEVRIGAGAFVCGEETALLHSIEGLRGTPRMRPPYPIEHGLWGCPTMINNVETLASVSTIIRDGAEAFAAVGTPTSRGTKVFALTGKLRQTGLVEVPMGITLREIVEQIGGGVPDGRAFKAAQTGGPSGGCIPEEHLDTPVDYEHLRALGSIMGSGGLVVMDDQSCMPDVARFFMEFCVDESCGKCVPCRVGTVQLQAILQRITGGQARPDDLDRLSHLCEVVQKASLCGLGQSAPNPVLTTLRYFRSEYEAHVRERRCPAGVCKMGS